MPYPISPHVTLRRPEGLQEYIPPHPVHGNEGFRDNEVDVFIAGSGPIGATFARLLVDAGYTVVMAEVGDQESLIPGSHKKNQIEYQKDIDRFVKVIQGALAPISVPPVSYIDQTLDPVTWTASDPASSAAYANNPRQDPHNNLDGEKVTRCVGGMSTHWTCAIPEFIKGLERPVIFSDEKADDDEWALLYYAAAKLIGRSSTEFDGSIRHRLVFDTLEPHYKDRNIKPLPLACHRVAERSPYVMWHSAENVFGDMFESPNKRNNDGKERGKFTLLTNLLCFRLVYMSFKDSVDIQAAEVHDLLAQKANSSIDGDDNGGQFKYYIRAKIYVVAAGAVCGAQILANSGFGNQSGSVRAGGKGEQYGIIPSLGTNITEQPMAFCQVALKRSLVDSVKEDLDNKPEWWRTAVKSHKLNFPNDPLPIPFNEPEPQVTIPPTPQRPWHIQIHRDAFSYGDVGPRVDPRLVVDLRWFGMQKPVPENKIIFEPDIRDAYGMPQPTFEFRPTHNPTKDPNKPWPGAEQAHEMIQDMMNVAHLLGGIIPGSNPQFMTPGLALHLGGTLRLGDNWETSVADFNSQVWQIKNLYVGGNGVIPTAFASNPTLTSMSLAIRSAYHIHEQLQEVKQRREGPVAPGPNGYLKPTPKDWVNWAYDESDPNYPRHDTKKLKKRV